MAAQKQRREIENMVKKCRSNSIITLGLWLIEKYNTADWRAGKVTGSRHPEVNQELLDAVGGRTSLLAQAAKLERQGIIRPEWKSVRTDIVRIHFDLEQMDRLCVLEGVENPRLQVESARACVDKWKHLCSADWLCAYYDSLLDLLDRGKLPQNARDEDLFRCLNSIAAQHTGFRWKRVFSAGIFHDSKRFEREYEKKILTILKKYSPCCEDGMEDEELLAEHGIASYSQTLEWKGDVEYRILAADVTGVKENSACRNEVGELIQKACHVRTSHMIYGVVLNARTLNHAEPIAAGEEIKKVITIENKANYESMEYDPGVLYIYTHGFFSPAERVFLRRLGQILPEEVQYYHWGDMDYGGIRIFQFIQRTVFSKLQPLYMDSETFEKAYRNGAGIPLEEEKRKKLEGMDAGCLEDLKYCILKNGVEIEQEVLLSGTWRP